MSIRWLILGVLAFARIAMGFQFQAVASVAAPLLYAAGLIFLTLGALALFRVVQSSPQARRPAPSG